MKSALITGAKLCLTGALIYWLWSTGKLDINQMSIIYKDLGFLFIVVCSWVITQAILGSLRWQMLLKGVGYQVGFVRVLKLQLTGLFFNTALPGAVGGDLVKAGYMIIDNPSKGKSPAMTSVLMDRIIGLFGLFTIGGMIVLLNYNSAMAIPTLRPVVYMIFLLIASVTLGLIITFKHYKGDDPILKLISKKYPGSNSIVKIYSCFRQYKDNKRYVLASWLLSVTIQGILTIYFYNIASKVLPTVEFSKVAMVFPVGILVTALPLAPGGLGVGHVAFDKLFDVIGYVDGASIFNIYVVSFLALNLLGFIPYMTLKKKPTPKNQDQEKNRPMEVVTHTTSAGA